MLDQSVGVACAALALGLDAPAVVKRAERMRSDLDRPVYWRDSASERTPMSAQGDAGSKNKSPDEGHDEGGGGGDIPKSG
jgi:hypothetical protein